MGGEGEGLYIGCGEAIDRPSPAPQATNHISSRALGHQSCARPVVTRAIISATRMIPP